MISTRRKFLRGVILTAITKYTGVLVSIFTGAVLARLLSPEDFGVVALITVFTTFFTMLSDVGIAPAIVQHKQLTENDLSSIFSFSIIVGLFLALLFYLSSTLIATFYNNLSIIPLIRLLSLSVLFSALKAVPSALLLKELRFKSIGLATVSVQVLSGCMAIILAQKGYSYYALVYKSIFDALSTLLIFFCMAPLKFKFALDTSAIKKIMRFSSYQFLFNFINYFSRNADNLLIGKFLGPSALGYYDKSYRLMSMPVQNLTNVITPVLHPVLSEFEKDRNKIYFAYLKLVKLLATIGFPLSVFLFIASKEIVFILYGPGWENSVPAFKVLALSVGVQMLLSSTGSIFQALNRTDLLFYAGLISAALMLSGITYGVLLATSIEAVGLGLLVAFMLNFLVSFYMLIKLALGCSIFPFFRILVLPLLSSIMIGFSFFHFSLNFSHDNALLSAFIKLMISLFCLLLVYFTNWLNTKRKIKSGEE